MRLFFSWVTVALLSGCHPDTVAGAATWMSTGDEASADVIARAPSSPPPMAPSRAAPLPPTEVATVATPSTSAEHDEAHAREERSRQAFEQAEQARAGFEGLELQARDIDALIAEARSAFSRAAAIAEDYRRAVEEGADRPLVLAALVGEARAWEVLIGALSRVPSDAPASSDITLLDGHARPWAPTHPTASLTPRAVHALGRSYDWVECLAVTRFVLVARASRGEGIRDASTRVAFERLDVYGEERIAQCIAMERSGDATRRVSGDPSFAPYVPGEFYEAPPGLILDMREGPGLPIDTTE